MLIWMFRFLFFVMMIAVLIVDLSAKEISGEPGRRNFWIISLSAIILFSLGFIVDYLTPKKSLAALAGVFFGLLVGMFFSWAFAQVVDMINDIYRLSLSPVSLQAIKWMLGICICFLAISVVMRTKDDVRFVVPYVHFAKETKGARPWILDTSVIIDGRIVDLCQSKLFDAQIVVPRFVLNELQFIADSSDKLKRNRGRRGLDVLNKMQANSAIDVQIDDTVVPEIEEAKGVDQKLLLFTKSCNGRLATTDYNLSKVAQVRSVDVVNINDMANSLKVVVLPGEGMEVRIIKPGEETDQGIGYLPDGTMVVVENARDKISKDVLITVTSSLQTSAGRMIFGRFESFAETRGEQG